jgi:uncharacterized protein YkwD
MSPNAALAVRYPTARHGRRLRAFVMTAAMFLGIFSGVVTAAAPASASLPPRTLLEAEIAVVIKNVINVERAVHGLAPVRMSAKIQLAARRHNVTMASYNTMSHQLPGEPYFGRRITLAGYYWNYAGENIAWNSEMNLAGVVLLQRLMYREKPPYDAHRLNILNRHYRHVGVDVYMDRVHHKVWLTTDFGHPSS